MDPNTAEPFSPVPVDSVPSQATPPPPQAQDGLKGVPKSWYKWAAVGGAAAVLIILAVVFNRLSPSSKSTPASTLIPTPAQSVNSQPANQAVAKPAPVRTTTTRGIAAAVTGTSLTVNSSGKSQTFSIIGTADFQRIISGTVEKGNVKTVPALASDLRVGQDVLVIANIGTTQARDVYIIK